MGKAWHMHGRRTLPPTQATLACLHESNFIQGTSKGVVSDFTLYTSRLSICDSAWIGFLGLNILGLYPAVDCVTTSEPRRDANFSWRAVAKRLLAEIDWVSHVPISQFESGHCALWSRAYKSVRDSRKGIRQSLMGKPMGIGVLAFASGVSLE
jgi:hypothetical protein